MLRLPSFPEDLPESVISRLEFSPMEDVGLHVLNETFAGDFAIHSLIPENPPYPLLLVRREVDFEDSESSREMRFVDKGHIKVDVFTEDPDGDEKGALISEAVRVAFRDAAIAKMPIPGRGYLHRAATRSKPQRKSDWATAQGPVQYADLPVGVFRYETRLTLHVRRNLT